MASIGKIARRSFLIGSAAILGGVAFGTYKYHKPAPNPLNPKDGQTALNPFVMVDQSGVTLVAPRAEMGQGVETSWIALIAEELDVRPEAVKVIHGPAAKAYYNSAMMAEALPGRGYDASNFQHSLGQIVGHMSKFLDLQVTGGSSSMKDGFERMRMAGATARETLKGRRAAPWHLSGAAEHRGRPCDRPGRQPDRLYRSVGRGRRDRPARGRAAPRLPMEIRRQGHAAP
jgi:isoquinoline 1-oxidoreductase beta subunit